MIEVRLGLRNSLRIDASVYRIAPERNGWYRIDGLSTGPRRVRYELLHDRFRIESPVARLSVQFRMRRSGFEWGGRTYRIRPMILFKPIGRGLVLILSQEKPVAKGRLTVTGVRLDFVDPELEPISAEIALGLALRGQAYLDVLLSSGSGDYAFVMPP